MSEAEPLISIITATYNRSNVLALAIQTVLNQSCQNWEHLIIGDACTDDTGTVVNAFSDKRIRFINLQQNYGEQSGPNNYGVSISSGDFIAYLNHDDLWFPDHLEQALDAINRTGADFASNLVCAFDQNDIPALIGLDSDNPEPFYWTPASAWLLKRTLIEDIGSWRFYRECYAIPSQDWLFRVWKAGKKIYLNRRLTVLAIQSGARRDSYSNRDYRTNEHLADELSNYKDLRSEILTRITLRSEAENRYPGLFRFLKRWLKNGLIFFIYKMSYNPYAFLYLVLYGKKGGFIDHLRKRRGLEKLK